MALLGLVVPLAIVAFALRRAYSEVDDGFVRQWARAHGLDLTPSNRLMVTWYLFTARVLRTWGVLGGLFLPPLVAAALGGRGSANFVWAFVGYLVGAIYAERSLARPLAPGRRSASLVPRELADYLPRRLLRAQRGLGALAVAGGIGALVAPYGVRSPWFERPDGVLFVAVTAGAAVLGLGLERLQRWLVQRPQPFVEPSLVAADDAIRSQSVHSVAGSGIAVLLVLCGVSAGALGASDVQVLRWTMWVFAALSFVLALYACLYYGHRAWRVPRRVPGRAEAAPA